MTTTEARDSAHPFQEGQQWRSETGIALDVLAVRGDKVAFRVSEPGASGYRVFVETGKELQKYAWGHDLRPLPHTIGIRALDYGATWQLTLHLPQKESARLIISARRAGRVDLAQLEELIYCRAPMYGEDIFDAFRLKRWSAPLQKKPLIEWVPLWLLNRLGYGVGRLLRF